MTNSEKAASIASTNQWCIDRSGYSSFKECEMSALEMAQWKDRQFKDYLIGKAADYEIEAITNPTYVERAAAINEIINELFGE